MIFLPQYHFNLLIVLIYIFYYRVSCHHLIKTRVSYLMLLLLWECICKSNRIHDQSHMILHMSNNKFLLNSKRTNPSVAAQILAAHNSGLGSKKYLGLQEYGFSAPNGILFHHKLTHFRELHQELTKIFTVVCAHKHYESGVSWQKCIKAATTARFQ